MPSYTEIIAQHWSSVACADLPESVRLEVVKRVLDTWAAAAPGSQAQETAALVQAMNALYPSASGASSVWFDTRAPLSPAQAALVNGTAAHARELDDFDGCGHTGAVVVPAACAVAEALGRSGQDLIVGIAAGYDLAGRLLNAAGGYRAHNGLGWHSTATCGTFGAALAAARVMGLDGPTTAHALGIAGTYVGGVWAFMQDGAMTKRLHPGKAAETGVMAAYLAQAGMTGPAFVLEAEWGGFFATYCKDAAQPAQLLEGLGQFNAIAITGIKPYACCRASHSSIDAMQMILAKEGLRAADIARIEVHCPAHTKKLVGNRDVRNTLQAQMSLPYALAVTVVEGGANLAQFEPHRAQDARVRYLMDNTELLATQPADYLLGPVVKVWTHQGQCFEQQIGYAKGHHTNPLSQAEVTAKARALLVPRIGEAAFVQLVQRLDVLESCDDFRHVAASLRGAPASALPDASAAATPAWAMS